MSLGSISRVVNENIKYLCIKGVVEPGDFDKQRANLTVRCKKE